MGSLGGLSAALLVWGDGAATMTLLAFLFGCHHAQKSRVFRKVRRNALGQIVWRGKHYQVCLECGAKLVYNWQGLGAVSEKVEAERLLAREI
jgi:hypothetical protein